MEATSTPNARSSAKLELIELLLGEKNVAVAPTRTIPRREEGVPCCTSTAQERLWFLDQLEPGNPFYNMAMGVRLEGHLDEAILFASLTAVVARHESLRTTFGIADGRPIQLVAPADNAAVTLERVDLSSLPADRRRDETARVALSAARRPFDLANGPLLRTILIELGPTGHVALLTLHHIVADHWSLAVLLRELMAEYSSRRGGSPAKLPGLPIQYADYADWQRRWLECGEQARQLDYWRSRLSDAPAALQWPTDFIRPGTPRFRGATVRSQGPSADPAEALRELSRREGTTLFMTLLAAFQALLHRYTGQADLIVGSPVANRRWIEIEGLIGFFVNMLILRVDASGDPPFRELLARVRRAVVEAQTHQDLPFEKLVADLHPRRDPGSSPLIQAVFALHHALPDFHLPGLRATPMEIETGTSKFDLSLTVAESGGDLRMALEYDTDLFAAGTMGRMLGHYRTLLDGIAADPDRRISQMPLLTPDERHRVLHGWNPARPTRAEADTLHGRFAARARAHPDSVAVVHRQAHLTYGALLDRARRLASDLRGLGIGPDVPVGLCVERSPEMVVGLLGILEAGGAYVPLDPAYPTDRLSLMAEDAGLEVILTQAAHEERFRGLVAHTVCLDPDRGRGGPDVDGPPESRAVGDHLAYVIYTSGSTGRPRAVGVAHGPVVEHLDAFRERFGFRTDDRVLQFTSLNLDGATEQIFTTLLSGAQLILFGAGSCDTADLIDDIIERGLTLINLPAGYWHTFVLECAGRPGPISLGSLRAVIIGADVLLPASVQAWQSTPLGSVPLFNAYGPTETIITATVFEVPNGFAAFGLPRCVPIGRPVGDRSSYILDGRGHPVPTGIVGELYIGGPLLARGYLDHPDLTAERFVPDPFGDRPGQRLYRTGDLARYLSDGNIEFHGRSDHQVKVRGFRIELGEIESALGEHPEVGEALVLAQEAAPGDRRLTAYVVPAEGRSPGPRDLREHLRARLPSYMVPAAFVVLDRLPLAPNGKLDRRALPPPVLADDAAATTAATPQGPFEEMLAAIWCDVLGVGWIGRHDNFFERGGHSLSAVRVVTRIRSTFRAEFSVRQLFAEPTLSGMAAAVAALVRQGTGRPVDPIRPISRGEELPLSFAQHRLWFLSQLDPDSPSYNVAGAVAVAGPLDSESLGQALAAIIRRHEALRTTFRSVDGRPIQVVRPAWRPALPIVELQEIPPGYRQAEARRICAREAGRPFDLQAGPLFRAALLRFDADNHIILINMHHIIADGWSMGILIREMATLYEAIIAGRTASLPSLPIQYADYAAWQREWLWGEVLEAQRSYWTKQLDGRLAVLDLPTDRPRPPVQRFRGASRGFRLSEAATKELEAFGRREGATLYMVLLACFQSLLHRYSGQEEVVVGTPIANRNRTETEGLIGFFVNSLVLRTNFVGNPSFRALLHRVRDVTLGAFTHQDFPFEQLVEQLQPARDLSRTPLFQVLFAFQAEAPVTSEAVPGLTLEPFEFDNGVAKFEISLYMTSAPHGLNGLIEYNTDLFEPETIRRMVEGFETLIADAVSRPDVPIGELLILPASERRRLLEDWNRTQTTGPEFSGLQRFFEAQVSRTPDAVALVAGSERLTYGELNRQANQLAHHLRDRGVGREVRVGVCLPRTTDLVIAVFGVLKAGGAYVPLDPTYPDDYLGSILADADVAVLLTRESLLPALPTSPGCVVCLDRDRELIASWSEADPVVASMPDQLAYVLYTSGSTGRPKGVMIEHMNACSLVSWAAQASPAGSLEMVLASTSLCFDLSVFEVMVPLSRGGTVVLVENILEAATSSFPEEVTLINTVPSAMAEVLRLGGLPSCVRVVNLAGESIPAPILRRLLEPCSTLEVLNLYGPTESTTYSTAARLTRDDDLTSPIGRPIANTRVYVLDAYFQPVPVGVPGELCIGGSGVARGYLRRPSLTAERFLPDPFGPGPGSRLYRTGDLVRYRDDGQLEFLGRADHQVKLRGYRVEPGEIEEALLGLPDVRSVAVVSEGDEPATRKLVAYWVPARDPAPTAEDLRGFLRARLPGHMVPSTFVAMSSLPLTPNGKIDRRALLSRERRRVVPSKPSIPPRSPAESTLARIWAEVLGVEQVGIHDDFFELGGHSLMATRIAFQVHAAFGVLLPLSRLFSEPTVAGLATAIVRQKAESGEDAATEIPMAPIRPASDRHFEPFPLTEVQQAYWIGRDGAFELGNVATQGYLEIDLLDLDLDRLGTACRHLIDRHPMLRAIIQTDGLQKVAPVVPPYQIETLDLRSEDPDAAAARLEAIRRSRSHQLLAADRWPLFDLRASLLAGSKTRLHVTVDALIADAWSLRILARDLVALYQDPGAPLPPMDLTFRDYVLAIEGFRETEAYRRSLDYWDRRLDDLPPAPELPLRQDPGAIADPRFRRRLASMEEETWRRLKARAVREGLTPSGLLLSAFAEVLTAWSRSPRFTITLTLFNRLPLHPQVNEIVGDFTSLTLLSVDNSPEEPFIERARRLQQRLWEDLDHRLVGGVRVLRGLSRRRGHDRPALMPVVFTSDLVHDPEGQGPPSSGLSGEVVYGITQTSQVWLDHQAGEQAGRLVLTWDAVEEVFPDGLLDEMFGRYESLLRRLADGEAWDESRPLARPFPAPASRATVRPTSGDPACERLQTLFASQAARRPHQAAIIAPSRSLTYAELLHESRGLAVRLRHQGVGPGELVAVVMEKGWEQVVAVLAVLQSGAAYLPLDPGLPAERLHKLLESSGAALLLTQPCLDVSLTWPGAIRRVRVPGDIPDGEPVGDWSPLQGPDDLAYVIYTSGSTGSPKGVMIGHHAAVNTILDVNDRFGLSPADRVLALSSLSFDLSVYDIFGTLAAGGTIVLPDAPMLREPPRWAEMIRTHRVTVWNSVPALFELLVDEAEPHPRALGDSIRLVLLSGDRIPVSLPDRFRRINPAARIVSLGGATEAAIWSIAHPIEAVDPSWKSIPYGRPLANQSVVVLDAFLEPCPVWATGDLYIGGVGLARGYWADEAATASSFIRHPLSGERLYRTGDLGRYLPDGNIEFLGREDSQVKVQGYRVELGEIEAALARHPSVRAAAARAVGEGSSNKHIVAYYVPSPGAVLEAPELRAFLAERLASYAVPHAFVPLSALPLTANGKVDLRTLPHADGQAPRGDSRSEPAGRAGRAISRVIGEVLGIADVDPSRSLLELGMNSVDAIRIANRLEAELGFRPRIEEIYGPRTIAGLAAAYEQGVLGGATPWLATGSGDLVPSVTSEWPDTVVLDPEQRAAFKERRPGLRRIGDGPSPIQLGWREPDEVLIRRFAERRSHRRFADRPIPSEAMSRLLTCLRQVSIGGQPKYLYASAGGLYPVQTYLHVKPRRIAGIPCGIYYHHPANHQLVPIALGVELDPSIHEPMVNQPIYREAAFSLFLVARLAAIAPMYGENSMHFVVIEAGLMSQLLELTAPECELGLCQIGGLDFREIRHLFALEESDHLVHSLVGGMPEPGEPSGWSPFQESHHRAPSRESDREEGEL